MNPQILKIDAENFCELAATTLKNGASIRFRAHGKSMHPAILDGDIITIAPLDHYSIKLGDVILYRTGEKNGLIAHRVVKIKSSKSNKLIYTRGDASSGKLEQVVEKNILGRATHIENNDKTIRIDTLKARTKGILWILRQSLRSIYSKLKRFLQNSSG